MVEFLFVIELFSLSLTVETLYAEIGRSQRFSKGWITMRLNFRLKVIFRANIYGPEAGSFHTKNFVAHFFHINLEYVEIDAFRTGDGLLSANISGGRGQFPATPVGVEGLWISLFRMVLRY